MTSSLRKKHPTTRRAAQAWRGLKITSVLLAWLAFLGTAFGQAIPSLPVKSNVEAPPKFVQSLPIAPSAPARTNFNEVAAPAAPMATQLPRARNAGDYRSEPSVGVELPGPQRLFSRESEAEFFDRLSKEMLKLPGGNRAVFPESSVLSREPYRPREFPEMVEVVEPSYVCHRRLYFEQPNFERIGYNFGVLQPAICLGVFYYDMALLPYHAFSDLRDCGECNVGKCLPGDPAPFLVPRERVSVTGAVGQAGAILGLVYLFP